MGNPLNIILVSCLLLTLSLTSAKFTDYSYTELDPKPLCSWQTNWVNNPIKLESNNIVSPDQTLTFYIRLTTALSNGVIDVKVPTGWGFTGTTGNVKQVEGVTLAANTDGSITVSDVTSPTTAGGSGPFGLTSRHYSNGNPVDMNLAFGCVATVPKITATTNLTIGEVSGSSYKVGTGNHKIQFKPTLSVDLWKHDVFQITIDKYWTLASPTCNVVKNGDNAIPINGTHNNDGDTRLIDCAVSAKVTTDANGAAVDQSQTLFIYGLNNDVDMSINAASTTVPIFEVSGFSTPNQDFSSSSWSLKTTRFMTTTTLEELNASSSSKPDVVVGDISIGSYGPTWSYETAKMKVGLKLLFDLTFSITNTVPTNGFMSFTVDAGVTASGVGGSNCYVDTYVAETTYSGLSWPSTDPSGSVNYLDCTQATNVIKFTTTPKLDTVKTFTTRIQITLAGTASSITEVVSSVTEGGNKIDKTSSGSSVSFTGTGNELLLNVEWFFDLDSVSSQTANVYTGRGSANTQLFRWQYKPTAGQSTDTDSKAKVSCPIASDKSDDSIYFEGDLTGGYLVDSDGTVNTTPKLFGTAGYMTLPSINFNSSNTLGYFEYTPVHVSDDYTLDTKRFAGFLKANTGIWMPRVAKNASTKYECRIEQKNAANDTNMVESWQIAVVARKHGTAASEPTIENAICTGAQTLKLIHLIEATLPIPASPTGYTYYLELKVANSLWGGDRFESGLTSGEKFPVSCTDKCSASTGATLEGDTTNDTLKIALGTSEITAGTCNCYIPTNDHTSSIEGDISIYKLKDDDIRYRQIYYQVLTGSQVAGNKSTANTAQNVGTVVAPTGMFNGDKSKEVTITFTGVAATTNSNEMGIVFPAGTTFSSKPSVTINTTACTASEIHYFESTNRNFAFPQVIVVQATGTCATTTTTAAEKAKITNVNLPLGAYSTGHKLVFAQGAGEAAACKISKRVDWDLSASVTFTSATNSLQATKGRGIDGVDKETVFKFTPSRPIPGKGRIEVKLNDFEKTTLTETATGTTTSLTNYHEKDNMGWTQIKVSTSWSDAKTLVIKQFQEVPSGNEVTITMKHLLPATYTTSTSSKIHFFASVKTFVTESATDEIEHVNLVDGLKIEYTKPDDAGIITNWTAETDPNIAGIAGVDFYASFKVANKVPAGGVLVIQQTPITLTGSTTASGNRDMCWMNLKHSGCVFNGSQVTFNVEEDILTNKNVEIYLDGAATNMATTTASSGGFRVETSWFSVTIDKKTTDIATSTFSSKAALTKTITKSGNGIVIEPTTAGEWSNYKFTFVLSQAFVATDKILIWFPMNYDPFIGRAMQSYNQDSQEYYLDCSSTTIGPTECKVKHWKVTVTGSKAPDTTTTTSTIDITFPMVQNPDENSTPSKFVLAHVNSSDAYIAYNNDFASVAITAVAKSIDFRSITRSGTNKNRLFATNINYTFKFYMDGAIFNSNTQLKVKFPMQYQLDLIHSSASTTLSCSTTYIDEQATDYATNKTETQWNSDSSCTRTGNWVAHGAMKTGSTAQSFTSRHLISFNVNGIANPEWAETRVKPTGTGNANTILGSDGYYDREVLDTNVWSTLYTYWSDKYQLFQFDNTNKTILYRTYGVLNSAYYGYEYDVERFTANNYNPRDMSGRISVVAGTQTSDLTIGLVGADAAMRVDNVKLTPSMNSSASPSSGTIAFTSAKHDFNFKLAYTSIMFRCSATIETPKGLYYADWSTTETNSVTSSKKSYHPPVKTLIEVTPAKSVENDDAKKYQFVIANGITNPDSIPVGGTSIPYRIYIHNAPATAVDVGIKLKTANANITIKPTTLQFTKDKNEDFFQVSVGSNYDVSDTDQILQFTLSGTDAKVYKINAEWTVTIKPQDTTTTGGLITTWNLGTATGTTQTFKPTVEQLGTIYWDVRVRVESKAGYCPTADSIETAVGTPVADTNTSSGNNKDSLSAKETDDYANKEVKPKDGETWKQFQKRLFKEHSQKNWNGYIVMETLEAPVTVTLNFLWSGTKYQICGYSKNVYGNYGAAKIEYWETTATDVNTQHITKTKGQGNTQRFTQYINPVLSYYQSVPQEQNQLEKDPEVKEVTRRRLQTTTYETTYTAVLGADRQHPVPSSAAKASVEEPELSLFKSDLAQTSNGGITVNSFAVTPYEQYTKRTTPTFNPPAASSGKTTNSITMSMSNSTAGETACVALTGSFAEVADRPTSEQVYVGQDANNADAPSCLVTTVTDKSYTCTISGLTENTTYNVFCTAVDNYWIWPGHMTFDSNGIPPVAVTTDASTTETDDDFSQFINCNVLALMLMVVTLLFN